MPRGDRTGPAGAGPVTGRGAGLCTGYDMPGFAGSTPRRFFGRGGGRGWGRGFWPSRFSTAPMHNSADEIGQLRQEVDLLEKALNGIKRRMEGLKSEN